VFLFNNYDLDCVYELKKFSAFFILVLEITDGRSNFLANEYAASYGVD
jgi:hypothetical protein